MFAKAEKLVHCKEIDNLVSEIWDFAAKASLNNCKEVLNMSIVLLKLHTFMLVTVQLISVKSAVNLSILSYQISKIWHTEGKSFGAVENKF